MFFLIEVSDLEIFANLSIALIPYSCDIRLLLTTGFADLQSDPEFLLLPHFLESHLNIQVDPHGTPQLIQQESLQYVFRFCTRVYCAEIATPEQVGGSPQILQKYILVIRAGFTLSYHPYNSKKDIIVIPGLDPLKEDKSSQMKKRQVNFRDVVSIVTCSNTDTKHHDDDASCSHHLLKS